MSDQEQKISTHWWKKRLCFSFILFLVAGWVGYIYYQNDQYYVDGTVFQNDADHNRVVCAENLDAWMETVSTYQDPDNHLFTLQCESWPNTTVKNIRKTETTMTFTEDEILEVPGGYQLSVLEYGVTRGRPVGDSLIPVYKVSYHHDLDSGVIPKNLRIPEKDTRGTISVLYDGGNSEISLQKFELVDQITGHYFTRYTTGRQLSSRNDQDAPLIIWQKEICFMPLVRPFVVRCAMLTNLKRINLAPNQTRQQFTGAYGDSAILKVLPVDLENYKIDFDNNGIHVKGFSPDYGDGTVVLVAWNYRHIKEVVAVTKNREGTIRSRTPPYCGKVFFLYYILDIPYDEIDHLEVSYWEKYYCVDYHINKLSDHDTDVEGYFNLMDQPVEYVRFEQEREYRSYLCNALQRGFANHYRTSFPGNFFPKEFENTSINEMFNEYLDHLPGYNKVEFDEEGLIRLYSRESWLSEILKK
jgi:hypothetical protein